MYTVKGYGTDRQCLSVARVDGLDAADRALSAGLEAGWHYGFILSGAEVVVSGWGRTHPYMAGQCEATVQGLQCRNRRGHGPFNRYCAAHAAKIEREVAALAA